MDGFKNSTKTQYWGGGEPQAFAKGGHVKGAAKISKVMNEFKSGELHSGSKKGPVVSNPKQAKAIALSEAREAGAKIPMRKLEGGAVNKPLPKKAVPAAKLTPLINPRTQEPPLGSKLYDKKPAKISPERQRMLDRNARLGLKEGGSADAKAQRAGEPVKKGLGGFLKKVAPLGVGSLAGGIGKMGGVEGALGMSGIGLLQQLLKKKQSGQPLTPAENAQVAQAQGAKKGGRIKC